MPRQPIYVTAVAIALLVPKTSSPQPTLVQSLSPNQAFNVQVEALPRSFKGHSFEQIFSLLWVGTSKIANKSEYESKDQFEDRVATELVRIDKLFASRFLSTQVRLAFVGGPDFSYDAELSKFVSNIALENFGIPPNESQAFSKVSNYTGWTATISEKIRPLGSYTVANVFGKTYNVTKTDEVKRSLYIKGCQISDGKFVNIPVDEDYSKRKYYQLSLDVD